MLLLMLFCAATVHAQMKLSPGKAKTVREFMTGRISIFKVEGATLREVVAVMRKEWKRQYPGDVFPVAVSEDAGVMIDKGAPMLPGTDLKDVTFFQVLKHITNAWLCQIDNANAPEALFMLKHSDCDDVMVKEFPITPGLLAALGLRRDAPPAQVQDAFARAGIRWKYGMFAVFSNDHLLVKASQDLVDNVGCIYLMIDAGMKIDGMNF